MNFGRQIYTAVLMVAASVTLSAQTSPFAENNVPEQDPGIYPSWTGITQSGTEAVGTSSRTPQSFDSKGYIFGTASLVNDADSVARSGYDLQTNATMMERIINWGRDGISPEGIKSTFIYMASTELFPEIEDRGTYGMVRTDFGDGEGEWLPINLSEWERIEPTRSGFCDVDYFKSGDLTGHLVAVSHANDNSGINVIVELDVPGSGEFLVQTIPGSENGLWPRVAVDGAGVIHAIWTYQNDDPLENNLRYSRTDDFGASWDPPISFAPQGNLRGVIGGDGYQIDANGNNVALWYFTQGVQILQIYSNANGASGSWVASLVANASYSNVFTGNDGRTDSVMFVDPMYGDSVSIGYVSDTVPTPGSSFDMMLLDDGTVIGAFPEYPSFLRRYLRTGEDTTAWTTRASIITRDSIAEYEDRAFTFVRLLEDGTVLEESLVPLPDGVDNSAEFLNVSSSVTGGPAKQFDYEQGLARWPQFGINGSGHIFLLFSSGSPSDIVTEELPGYGTARFYRSHMYAVRSTDDGASWTTPQNLSPDGVDAQFASLADWVDDEAHIVVQADTYPGTYVNHGDTNGLGIHPPIFNNIETLMIPSSSFAPTSVTDAERIYGTSAIASIAPNPASGKVMFSYSIGRTAETRLQIVDATGTPVLTFFDGRRVAGEYTLQTDISHLPTGSYFVVLTVDGESKSSPLNVVR